MEKVCMCECLCVVLLYPGPYGSAHGHVSEGPFLVSGCLSWLFHIFIQLCESQICSEDKDISNKPFPRREHYKTTWCFFQCPFTTRSAHIAHLPDFGCFTKYDHRATSGQHTRVMVEGQQQEVYSFPAFLSLQQFLWREQHALCFENSQEALGKTVLSLNPKACLMLLNDSLFILCTQEVEWCS